MISTIHDATFVNKGRKDGKRNMEIKKLYAVVQYNKFIKDVTVAQVFGNSVWASDIGWPVLRHSRERGRDNIKGCFERMSLLLVAGGQKGLAIVTVR